MDDITIEIIIILLLIITNGLFSMSEMAIVSARKNRLEQKAEDGDKNAARALALAENPNRFLSTVQVGITLIGILSGAFGGATIAHNISLGLNRIDWLAPYSEGIGVGLVVLVITYLSLVIGELVPKRLALNNAEKIAARVSSLMQFLSVAATPIVALLSASTNLALRLLGVKRSTDQAVTEDDLKSMLDQGTEAGVFDETEQDMVERIFRLGDHGVSSLMTPRMDVVFLDMDSQADEIRNRIVQQPFSRFPVFQQSQDNVIGIVRARDLLLQHLEGRGFDIQDVLHEPLFIPESTNALDVLERFKISGAEMAVVIDEFGGVLGLVSRDDILEAIVGDVATPQGEQEPEAVRREDGSWLFDGLIQVDELKDYLDIDILPGEEEGYFETLSGFMMAQLGKVPISGDHFEYGNFHFEVMDMDRRRVDKVLVVPSGETENPKTID